MKQSTALKILKLGENVFLTGQAGAGKTFLLQKYIDLLKERGANFAVLAPTGIAASHLKGRTIHSFFSLGIKDAINEIELDSLLQKKSLVQKLTRLEVLIIDEISMVAPALLESMDKILRGARFTNQPFGGVQVILAGDFFQLPPVGSARDQKRFAWQSPV